jgi:hypothetical protein
MAKLIQTNIAVTLSRLVRNTEPDQPILTEELKSALLEVIQEIAGANVLVEVEITDELS